MGRLFYHTDSDAFPVTCRAFIGSWGLPLPDLKWVRAWVCDLEQGQIWNKVSASLFSPSGSLQDIVRVK